MGGIQMSSALTTFGKIISVAMFFLMLGMVVVMNSLVVTRYAFSWSPSWTEEVTRYAMVWMVMLGAGLLALFEDHITLYLFNEKFGVRTRAVINSLIRLLIAAISALVAWTGYKFAFSMSNILAPGSQMSMTVPTIAVPIGATMICVFSLLLIWNDLRRAFGAAPFTIPKQKLFMDGSFRPADDLEEQLS
jgi:TRAP-type C4-dicarboxylate transport system permease small subunit